MTQLTINVEDKSIVPHLKKILNAIEGVSIAPSRKNKVNGIDRSLDEIKAGKVKRFDSVEDFFNDLGI